MTRTTTDTMPPDTLGALAQIHEAAGFIEADTAGLTFDALFADRRRRQVVELNFVNIGAAVNRLQRRAPDVVARIGSSKQWVELGNHLQHDYDRIDYPAVWFAVRESLPLLRAEVETLLREAEGR